MITWGQLAKSQDDPEKIEEAIARMISEHNADPEAHLCEGGSLRSHKMAEIIDHLVNSILGEKLHKSAKVGDCIVAPEGGDYTSIQAALNDGKKSIFVKAGIYEITSPITILSSGVTIKGESWTNTIIKVKNGANCHAIVVGDGATEIKDIVIEDIQIDGNGEGQTLTNLAGIYFYGGSSKLITGSQIGNCFISKCKKYGIYFRYSNNNVIRNNQIISNHDQGIRLDYSQFNVIEGNQANWNYFHNLYLYYSDKNTISSNQVNKTIYGGEGLYLDHSNNNTITANQISYSSPTGIGLFYSNANLIISNQVNSNDDIGIDISSSSSNNILVANQVSFNGSTGINVENNSNSNLLASNEVNSNGDVGILVSNSDNNILIANKCSGNGLYGISIANSGCDLNFVVKNYLTGNGSGSLYDAGTGTIKGASTTNDNVV